MTLLELPGAVKIIVNDNADIITIKNNNTKEEHKIKLEDVIDFLDQNLEEEE